MFCKNCGKQIADGAKFCAACGASIAEEMRPETNGFNETIVVEVSKRDEEKAIYRHQCFGWSLLNNQEVNITDVRGGGSTVNGTGSTVVTSSTMTYVKLTFSRNTAMRNYGKLDELYREYCRADAEYKNHESAMCVSDFHWLSAVITLSLFALIGVVCGVVNKIDSSFTDEIIFNAFLGFFCGSGVGGILAIIPAVIFGKRKQKDAQKKHGPILVQLEQKMETLAAEGKRYLI